MISPEILRRYPFFGPFNDTQLKAIAMVADEAAYIGGENIFEEGGPAIKLYLLLEGSVDLYYKSEEEFDSSTRKEFLVGSINPGEIFSLSALIEPYQLTATARADRDIKVIQIDAPALRAIMQMDQSLANKLLEELIKALMERLRVTRVQLAACWAS